MAAGDHREAGRGADEDTAGLVDPAVVEGVLHEEPDAENEHGGADVEHPLAADAAFEGILAGWPGRGGDDGLLDRPGRRRGW